MQVIKSLIRLVLFICPIFSFAQSTFIPHGDKAYELIDRIEIKESSNNFLNFSSIKPYNRKSIVTAVNKFYNDSLSSVNLTKIDRHDLQSLMMDNSEWAIAKDNSFFNKKPFLGGLYKTKANAIEYNSKDFFLAMNPVLDYQKSFGSAIDKGAFLSSRGITVRGLISNKIGFSTTIIDNQEQGPAYFNNRVNKFNAVPGVGFIKTFKNTGFDYFNASGYITFNVAKTVGIQFGYDNNFIGNGYRSLFLSDYSNNYLFLKASVTKGRFNYQSIFAELFPSFAKTGDTLLDRKYAAFHHVSFNATQWLNVGLFEGVIFGTKNEFNLKYLDPVIFLRHIAGFNGSSDNAIAGADFKANFAHSFQIYGQLLIDEFDFGHSSKKEGYWANKTGYQIGVKYIDAFHINNLDLQFETNKVRPFTYAYNNPVASYTHYNLPLAHPLGANFKEYIGILKYHPLPKWRMEGILISYKQGLDSLGYNMGNNPFENTLTRSRDFNYNTASGNQATCLNLNLNLSYELMENLFIEGGIFYRKYNTQINDPASSSKLITAGIRWNIFKRRYDL